MSKPKCTSTDMLMTGGLIKRLVQEGGYSVGEVQQALGLSCPQPIYRWYKGQSMPSIDNLFILSQMLGLHMEDMLIQRDDRIRIVHWSQPGNFFGRLEAYIRRIKRLTVC
ncbi:MAG: helix-turn-helix domain-containing protein [Lachnospiraceae bacterium]|nr:helix-turn-helix domain-containing protein [Lachnospiraceae bacterium]